MLDVTNYPNYEIKQTPRPKAFRFYEENTKFGLAEAKE
jgi:hypothetical protein